MKKGIWFTLGAYLLWGIFPIYWKWLHGVPALQLLGHRIVWSFLLLGSILLVTRQVRNLWGAAFQPGILRTYLLAAVLIGINWLTYIWAINAGFLIESSLGYFINPLFSVLLGVVFLRERLRPWQWLPLLIAAAGVIYLTTAYGRLPWIALTLAISFGLYGLVKKQAPLGPLQGLTLETGLLFLPAVGYLVFVGLTGSGAFLGAGLRPSLLMVAAGAVTTLPLLLFASGVTRIPLTMVGFLQYINPCMQFLLGVLLYREHFDSSRLVGFGLVWLALVLFSMEGFLFQRRQVPAAVAD
jgi:chloramphenicol-sensitive protein RarD